MVRTTAKMTSQTLFLNCFWFLCSHVHYCTQSAAAAATCKIDLELFLFFKRYIEIKKHQEDAYDWLNVRQCLPLIDQGSQKTSIWPFLFHSGRFQSWLFTNTGPVIFIWYCGSEKEYGHPPLAIKRCHVSAVILLLILKSLVWFMYNLLQLLPSTLNILVFVFVFVSIFYVFKIHTEDLTLWPGLSTANHGC